MVGYFNSLGLCSPGAMGPVALSFAEVAAWQEGAGVTLAAWEFAALRAMSRAYVQQLHDSEDPTCPPPYGAPAQEYDRDKVAKKISGALRALMRT